jgi:hypothetical protein
MMQDEKRHVKGTNWHRTLLDLWNKYVLRAEDGKIHFDEFCPEIEEAAGKNGSLSD